MPYKSDIWIKIIAGLIVVDLMFGFRLWKILGLPAGWEDILTGIAGFTLLIAFVLRINFLKKRDTP